MNSVLKLTQEAEIRQVFREASPLSSIMDAAAAVRILAQSGLDVDTLERIWEMSDLDRDGKLSENEFVLAFHLCICASKRGLLLPKTLPPALQQEVFRPQAKQPTRPQTLVTKFRKGDSVEHLRLSDKLLRKCTVVGVHLDDVVNGVYYTLRVEDGTMSELQSQEGRIALPGEWQRQAVAPVLDEDEDEFGDFSGFTAAAAPSNDTNAPPLFGGGMEQTGSLQTQPIGSFGAVLAGPTTTSTDSAAVDFFQDLSFGDFSSAAPAFASHQQPQQMEESFGDFTGAMASSHDVSFGAFTFPTTVPATVPAPPRQTLDVDISFGDFTAPATTMTTAAAAFPKRADSSSNSGSFLPPMPMAAAPPRTAAAAVARPILSEEAKPVHEPAPVLLSNSKEEEQQPLPFNEEHVSSLNNSGYSGSSYIPDTSMLVATKRSPPQFGFSTAFSSLHLPEDDKFALTHSDAQLEEEVAVASEKTMAVEEEDFDAPQSREKELFFHEPAMPEEPTPEAQLKNDEPIVQKHENAALALDEMGAREEDYFAFDLPTVQQKEELKPEALLEKDSGEGEVQNPESRVDEPEAQKEEDFGFDEEQNEAKPIAREVEIEEEVFGFDEEQNEAKPMAQEVMSQEDNFSFDAPEVQKREEQAVEQEAENEGDDFGFDADQNEAEPIAREVVREEDDFGFDEEPKHEERVEAEPTTQEKNEADFVFEVPEVQKKAEQAIEQAEGDFVFDAPMVQKKEEPAIEQAEGDFVFDAPMVQKKEEPAVAQEMDVEEDFGFDAPELQKEEEHAIAQEDNEEDFGFDEKPKHEDRVEAEPIAQEAENEGDDFGFDEEPKHEERVEAEPIAQEAENEGDDFLFDSPMVQREEEEQAVAQEKLESGVPLEKDFGQAEVQKQEPNERDEDDFLFDELEAHTQQQQGPLVQEKSFEPKLAARAAEDDFVFDEPEEEPIVHKEEPELERNDFVCDEMVAQERNEEEPKPEAPLEMQDVEEDFAFDEPQAQTVKEPVVLGGLEGNDFEDMAMQEEPAKPEVLKAEPHTHEEEEDFEVDEPVMREESNIAARLGDQIPFAAHDGPAATQALEQALREEESIAEQVQNIIPPTAGLLDDSFDFFSSTTIAVTSAPPPPVVGGDAQFDFDFFSSAGDGATAAAAATVAVTQPTAAAAAAPKTNLLDDYDFFNFSSEPAGSALAPPALSTSPPPPPLSQ